MDEAAVAVDVEELERRVEEAKRQVAAVEEKMEGWVERRVAAEVDRQTRPLLRPGVSPIGALAPLHERLERLEAAVEEAQASVEQEDSEQADEIEARTMDVARAVGQVELGAAQVDALMQRLSAVEHSSAWPDGRRGAPDPLRELERLEAATRELAALLHLPDA